MLTSVNILKRFNSVQRVYTVYTVAKIETPTEP